MNIQAYIIGALIIALAGYGAFKILCFIGSEIKKLILWIREKTKK